MKKEDIKQLLKKDWVVSVAFVAIFAILVFACWWAWLEFRTSPPYVDFNRYPIKGIDISRHNGMMNFEAIAEDDVRFVFIKASEGATHRDENFNLNYSKAVRAGLAVGAYHYFRFDVDGIAQAVNFCKVIGESKLAVGAVIDVEDYGNATGVETEVIVDELSSMADYLSMKGHRVIIYTNKDGYYDYIYGRLGLYPLWICSFSEVPISAEWTFWQYNHRGRVKGIKGDVDLNVFSGSEKEWVEFIGLPADEYDE